MKLELSKPIPRKKKFVENEGEKKKRGKDHRRILGRRRGGGVGGGGPTSLFCSVKWLC
jgi:hypothetical protein